MYLELDQLSDEGSLDWSLWENREKRKPMGFPHEKRGVPGFIFQPIVSEEVKRAVSDRSILTCSHTKKT